MYVYVETLSVVSVVGIFGATFDSCFNSKKSCI